MRHLMSCIDFSHDGIIQCLAKAASALDSSHHGFPAPSPYESKRHKELAHPATPLQQGDMQPVRMQAWLRGLPLGLCQADS